MRSLTVIQVSRKTALFKKGDSPTNWFILYEGELDLLHSLGSENKLIGRLTRGQQVGEREILRNKSYSFTCLPNRTSLVLCLKQDDFVSLLAEQLDSKLSVLRTFVHNYIPLIGPYSWNFKEKVGYGLTLNEFKRGETVIEKGFLDDQLHFVFEGELAVAAEVENRLRNVIKLGLGSSFAEECTLLGKGSFYCIKVSSERAVIASMKKLDIFHLPDETLAKLKFNLKQKIFSRSGLIESDDKKSRNYSGTPSPAFKSANKQAREKLMTYILRNRPCTPKRILNISRIRNQQFKDQLQSLRDCSPRRIRYFNGIFSHSKFSHRTTNSNFFN
jgi:CRP-like cAMP-binding protein